MLIDDTNNIAILPTAKLYFILKSVLELNCIESLECKAFRLWFFPLFFFKLITNTEEMVNKYYMD